MNSYLVPQSIGKNSWMPVLQGSLLRNFACSESFGKTVAGKVGEKLASIFCLKTSLSINLPAAVSVT